MAHEFDAEFLIVFAIDRLDNQTLAEFAMKDALID